MSDQHKHPHQHVGPSREDGARTAPALSESGPAPNECRSRRNFRSYTDERNALEIEEFLARSRAPP